MLIDTSLVRWIAACSRPYRLRLAALAIVSLAEVGLGALTPWTLKLVVDNVLTGHALPHWISAITTPLGGTHPAALLGMILVAGLLLQVISEFVSMFHT